MSFTPFAFVIPMTLFVRVAPKFKLNPIFPVTAVIHVAAVIPMTLFISVVPAIQRIQVKCNHIGS